MSVQVLGPSILSGPWREEGMGAKLGLGHCVHLPAGMRLQLPSPGGPAALVSSAHPHHGDKVPSFKLQQVAHSAAFCVLGPWSDVLPPAVSRAGSPP